MRPNHALTLLLASAATLATATATAAAQARGAGPLPLVLHVAIDDGRPVATEAWLGEAISLANGHFAEAGVSFGERERRTLPEGFATLATIRDRHRLKRFLVPRAINVFVVDRIDDPVPSEATRRAAARQGFEPTGRLGGAHVRAPRHSPGTYMIVSRRSAPLVVTHELGHFLGAPHHADPENIMSYGRERSRFDERQRAAFRTFARRHVRRGALRPMRRPAEPD